MIRRPYFYENSEWYKEERDKDGMVTKITLTDKAPPKAIESYKEYMKIRYGKIKKDKDGKISVTDY